MPFTLKYVNDPFVSGVNILASEQFKFIEGGATFDATKVGNTTLPVGTAVARDKTTGKWEKFTDARDTANAYDDYGVLAVEVTCDGTTDVIVGEVLVWGSVYDAKMDASATTQFRTKVADRIRFVKHV